MRITHYAIGIVLVAALAGCTTSGYGGSYSPPPPAPDTPAGARHQKLELACIESGGIGYMWNKFTDSWSCNRSDNTIKIER